LAFFGGFAVLGYF